MTSRLSRKARQRVLLCLLCVAFAASYGIVRLGRGWAQNPRTGVPSRPPAPGSPEWVLRKEEVKRLYGKAQTAYDRGDFATARKLWLASLQKAESIEYTKQIGLVALALAIAHCEHKYSREAVGFGTRSARLLEHVGEKGLAAEALKWVAYAHYDAKEYSPSVDAARRGVQLAEAAGDTPAAAQLLNDSSLMALAMGRPDTAAALGERALGRFQVLGDRAHVATVLSNLGAIYTALGQYERALNRLRRAREQGSATQNARAAAQVLHNLAATYFQLGRWEEAAELFEEALKQWDPARAPSERAAAENDLGCVYLAAGLFVHEEFFKVSEAHLRRALEAYARPGEHANLAAVCNNLGNVCVARGEIAKAGDWYRRALKLLGPGDAASPGKERLLGNLAHLASLRGSWDEALQLYLRAVTICERSGNQRETAVALSQVGAVYLEKGLLHRAAEAFERARRLYEDVREQVSQPSQIGAFQRASVSNLYGLYAALLVKQKRVMEALAMAERGRAQGLARLATRSSSNGVVPPNLQTLMLFTSRSDRPLVRVTQGGTIAASVNAKQPRAPSVRGSPPTAGGLSTLVRKHPDTLFLEWSFADDRHGLLFALSYRDGVRTFVLPAARKKLRTLIREWRRHLRDRSGDPTASAGELQYAQAVGEALLGPLQKTDLWVAGRYQRLVLVADGPMLDVPMAAIREGDGKRLIDRFALSSSAALAELTWPRAPRKPTGTLLCVSHPGGEGATRAGDRGPLRAQVSLENAEKEAERIARLVPGARTLKGAQARERDVKRQISRYGLLHFATHAEVQGWDGMASYLQLAGDAAAAGEDGQLTAEEVLHLPLSAQLAVLAACETGEGRPMGGEGLMGLAWAFRAAGCPSVLASQWQVDDRSTADLMTAFYQGLVRGQRKDDALRQAIRQVRSTRRDASPFYWAAFQIIGDTSPLADIPGIRRR